MLRELYKEICDRKENSKAESYTSYLFLKGEDKILKKIGEECTEVILAAKSNEEEEIVKEMADLTYHCLVLLAEKGVSLQRIEEELNTRRGSLSKLGERKEIADL